MAGVHDNWQHFEGGKAQRQLRRFHPYRLPACRQAVKF
jgi:hypothetical protein